MRRVGDWGEGIELEILWALVVERSPFYPPPKLSMVQYRNKASLIAKRNEGNVMFGGFLWFPLVVLVSALER